MCVLVSATCQFSFLLAIQIIFQRGAEEIEQEKPLQQRTAAERAGHRKGTYVCFYKPEHNTQLCRKETMHYNRNICQILNIWICYCSLLIA